jgi:3-deoxy-D-manno-octulosonate 8-phosphate phosphatase (KDO 8-P phosphatase)
MASTKEIVFVMDVDGTLTDGKMYYTKEGKTMKAFGCDDFDAIKTLGKKVHIHFISGDEKGFEISKKRADEMNIPINLVPSNAKKRWDWISETYVGHEIIFMGDGINDYTALEKANMSFTVVDALPHILEAAQFNVGRRGGDRAVAAACLMINAEYGLGCFEDIE